ncbi:MAG: 16S rRNA (uracil(1498)-N(3))-methyltransferase [Chitinophagaceae bacterium]|nr:16S rRNA (uracil(1498)-N(3))-methyltransferase [Chitinophagaceae bacterium]
MPLPFFYNEEIPAGTTLLTLDENTAKHVVQVLRMQPGEQLQLTNGKGNLFTAEISGINKKRCEVKIKEAGYKLQAGRKIAIAISLIKNNSRFEWFLEKATEIGIAEIIPLLCSRTEKQHFRYDRMKTILISAMLQSQQCWLPALHEPIFFFDFVNTATQQQKFIAHCADESSKKQLTTQLINQSSNQLILIGPEGDFTATEIKAAIENNFIPVALGDTRLRTETAGIVAATLLQNG